MMSFLPFVALVPSRGGATPALVQRLQAGDNAVLAELYRREAGAVYRYALALSGNAAWAADATQEAFVALAGRPQGYDAARHALSARWREGKALLPLPEEDEAPLPEGETMASPETLLLQRQSSAEFWAALRQLPAPFREALLLVDLQERPYAEAARIAGIELNTLRTRLHRARLKLAALLGADPGSLS